MRISTLGEIADWGSGGTPKRNVAEYFGDGTPWLSIADLNDGVVTTARESLTAAGLANSPAKVVPAGTIFIAMYGSIGKLGIAATEMATSQAIAFAKPKDDLVDRRFLFQFLLAQRPQLQSMGRGGTQMNIGQSDLKSWTIPLPPLPEQRRIAAILDHADALRTKRRQVLAHLDTLTDSIFDGMFARESHPVVSLADIARVKGGKRLPKGAPYADRPTRHPYIRVVDLRGGNVQAGNLRFLTPSVQRQIARYTVDEDDVIVSIAGSIGLTATVPPELAGANLTENAAKIVPTELQTYSGAWLARALQTRSLQDQIAKKVGQVTIGKLALFRIEQLELPLPPLALQAKFVEQAAMVDSQRVTVERTAAAEDELFSSLQSRAFRGEL